VQEAFESLTLHCHRFCMAVSQQAGNNRGPVFLRSYQNKQEMSLIPDIKIWQAARATSAAPAYFAPITVGNYTLVDGGMGANNPLGWYEPLNTATCTDQPLANKCALDRAMLT